MSTRTTLEAGTNSVNPEFAPKVLSREQVEQYWPELETLLLASVKASSGMTSIEELRKKLEFGIANCIVFIQDNRIELAVVLDAVQYYSYRSARIIAIGGTKVAQAMQFMPTIESWCIAEGCVEIEGWCNPVLERFWRRRGAKRKVVMMTWDLRRKLQ